MPRHIYQKIIASSGNRTRAARVAGEHSTTEPTMPWCNLHIVRGIYSVAVIYYLLVQRSIKSLLKDFNLNWHA